MLFFRWAASDFFFSGLNLHWVAKSTKTRSIACEKTRARADLESQLVDRKIVVLDLYLTMRARVDRMG